MWTRITCLLVTCHYHHDISLVCMMTGNKYLIFTDKIDKSILELALFYDIESKVNLDPDLDVFKKVQI